MEVHLSDDDYWTKSGDTMVSGSAFFDNKYVSEKEFADRISNITDPEELKRILSQANGFFSIIHDTGEEIYAAVDHVRSWPLYYTITDDVYISDSAEWVHENGARRGYDPVAGTEYLFTCFVPGKDTLSRDVKQVQAGELVVLSAENGNKDVNGEQYFSYSPVETSSTVNEGEFNEVLVEATNRLIEYADGRTILLGLSGGYDSRLIALMLRRLGYDDVITFTGRSASGSSSESSIAKTIATDLDFEHIELVTTKSDYHHLDDSPELELVNDIGYLSEYPSVNKVVQRRKLQEAGIDPSDVVLVLGHQLLGAGTFLPEWVRDQETLSRSEFFELVWNLHYSHWETPRRPQWRRLFEGRILERIPTDLYQTGDVESTPDAIKGFEQFYWQERLPKYIIIRREYMYLGFDVWYPLLDRALYSFFQKSNYRDRVGKRALKEYVRQLDVQVRDKKSDLTTGTARSSKSVSGVAWNRMVSLVHALPDPAKEFIRRKYNEYQSKDAYERDPRYKIVSENEFNSISFPKVGEGELHRTLLLFYLYRRGFFDFCIETEFDRALSGS